MSPLAALMRRGLGLEPRPRRPPDGPTLLGRERIDLLLADLGLHAPTRHDPRGVYPIDSVYHVAIADERATSTHIGAAVDSRRLSDPDAYVVDGCPRSAAPLVS